MKKKSKAPLLLILVILLVGAYFAGWLPRHFKAEELNANAEQETVLKVRVLKIKPDLKKQILVLPSSTVAFHETPIWARVNGYLKDYYKDIGDRVTTGQLLSIIDTPELDAELDQARADMANFKARLEIAEITAERWQGLYNDDPGATTQEEVDERNYAYKSAQAAAVAAWANVVRLRSLQDFKNIVAPFSGIITERTIDIGSLITAGSNDSPQQLFKIANIDIIRVFVDVPQNYFRSIQVGQAVEVKVAEFQNKVFKGTVTRTANALDPIARTLLTEIYIDNKNQELFPGLYAEVAFSLTPTKIGFVIPAEALIIRTGPPQVAIVNRGQNIELRTVTIGIDNGSSVEIVEGIEAGDSVVINPSEKIQPGVHVQVAS